MSVFLEESVEVSRPFEAVQGRFCGDVSWITPLARGGGGSRRGSLRPCRAIVAGRARSA